MADEVFTPKKIEFLLVEGRDLEIKYDDEEAVQDNLNNSIKNKIILRLLRDIAVSYKAQGKSQVEYFNKLNKYIIKQIAKISDEIFNKENNNAN